MKTKNSRLLIVSLIFVLSSTAQAYDPFKQYTSQKPIKNLIAVLQQMHVYNKRIIERIRGDKGYDRHEVTQARIGCGIIGAAGLFLAYQWVIKPFRLYRASTLYNTKVPTTTVEEKKDLSPEDRFCEYLKKAYGYVRGDRIEDREGQIYIGRLLQSLYKWKNNLGNEKATKLFEAVSRFYGEERIASVDELMQKLAAPYNAIVFNKETQRYAYVPNAFYEVVEGAVHDALKHNKLDQKDRANTCVLCETLEKKFHRSLATAYLHWEHRYDITIKRREAVAKIVTNLNNEQHLLDNQTVTKIFNTASEPYAENNPPSSLSYLIINLMNMYNLSFNEEKKCYEAPSLLTEEELIFLGNK